MTVVAAIAAEGRITMAADTASITNHGTVVYGREKILRHRTTDGTEFLMAFAGNAGLITVTRRGLTVATAPGPEADDQELTRWAEAVSEACAELALDARPRLTDSNGNIDGEGMLAYQGRIWTIAQQSCTLIPHGYWGIGSGQDLAVGFIAAAREYTTDAAAILRGAVRTACLYDDGCRVTPGQSPQIEVLDS